MLNVKRACFGNRCLCANELGICPCARALRYHQRDRILVVNRSNIVCDGGRAFLAALGHFHFIRDTSGYAKQPRA